MEKLFEVIGSLIPEEQEADIKAQIDGIVGEMLKDNSTNVKKELSGKYGVNFFEEDIHKAYDNKAFVKKSLYEEELKRFEDINTQFTTLQEEHNTLLSSMEELRINNSYVDMSVALLKEGLNPDRLDSIKPLLSVEGELADRVEDFKNKFPEFFRKETITSTITPTKENETLTGAERYFQQKKKMTIR